MAYTPNDLVAIQSAIARGVTRVRMNGEEVTYASLADLVRIERKIKLELGLETGRRIFNPQTSSGWR